ncbi:MAG: hypothetical protein OXC05_10605 [Halieaceae bacterium]|nr:hypothetical protein [Halieaceae bacterium]
MNRFEVARVLTAAKTGLNGIFDRMMCTGGAGLEREQIEAAWYGCCFLRCYTL